MTDNPVKLVTLTTDMQSAFIDMLLDYVASEVGHAHSYQNDLRSAEADWPGFVHRLEEEAADTDIPAGKVGQTTFWLEHESGMLLGGLRMRHTLTPLLAHEAGHIGYDIRPSQRGRGYGTIQLALALLPIREMGYDHVLITCLRHNIASRRVIEKNGGVFENEVLSWRHADTWYRRYWIELIDISEANP